MIRRLSIALLPSLAALLLVLASSAVPATAQDAEDAPAVKPKAAAKAAPAKPTTAKPAVAKPSSAVSAKPAAAAKTATGTARPAATGAKPVAAAAKPAAAGGAAAAGGGQPVQLAVFGDWGAYASDTAKGKVCYALARPKERLPKSLQRGDGYLFISSRPAENVRNEVSVVLGFPTKDGVEGSAGIGSTTFALVTKGDAAWVKNAAEDAAFVESLRKGTGLVVKATSKKGNESTDRYALNGLVQALDRVRKECP